MPRSRDGVREQQRYFAARARDYASGYAGTASFRARVQRVVSPHIHGQVLDLGNGGLLVFDPARATAVTIADLCAGTLATAHTAHEGRIRPLSQQERARVRRVAANALELPFADQTFDVVVMAYLLHHVSAPSRPASQYNVARALAAVTRVLRHGGRLVLVECCPTRIPKWVQDRGFTVWSTLARWAGKPLPYFLHEPELRAAMATAGLALHSTAEIAWDRRVHQPMFPTLAPPGWLWQRLLQNRVLVAERALCCGPES